MVLPSLLLVMVRHGRKPFAIIAMMLIMISSITAWESKDSSKCNRMCGPRELPRPFGFSAHCHIPLNCSNATAKIGDFLVENVTSNGIIVKIPPDCKRRPDKIKALFGENYAPSWRNSLFLYKCKKYLPCPIKQDYVEQQLNIKPCYSENSKISCFSLNLTSMSRGYLVNVMNYSELEQFQCENLFSSMTFDTNENGSEVSLMFERLRLEWWRTGRCGDRTCSPNADCIEVMNLARGALGHQCVCVEGFEGNGYPEEVCRRVRKCRSSSFLSSGCDGTNAVVIVTGLVVGVVLMAGLAMMCYCFRKRLCASLRTSSSAKHLLSKAASDSSIPFVAYKEIEKATDNFSEMRRLGTGAYGTVYQGRLQENEWVAVKRLRDRDSASLEHVINEIKMLSSVSHPNLVRLLGCCIRGSEPILVYEFMPNGTLCQHLQRERGSRLSWLTRLNIGTQTARAIAYLHSAIDPPIYHRDVKSSNILLDSDFNAKVADFGLSRLGLSDISYVYTGPQGTPGYLDPQYHQDFQLSDKSDVYSFGVVLSEILTGLKVVDLTRPHSEVNLATLVVDKIGCDRLEQIIDPFLQPDIAVGALPSINSVAELVFRCLAFQRDMRPTMTEVAAELERITIEAQVLSSDKGKDEQKISGKDLSSPVSTNDRWPSDKSSPYEND